MSWNVKRSRAASSSRVVTSHNGHWADLVSAFEEAVTVFFDDRAIEFYDDSHSDWEDRMLLLGLSTKLRLLLVCHCYRESDSVIRIISARNATKNESELYRR